MNSPPISSGAHLQVGDLAPVFEERPVFGLPIQVPSGRQTQVLVFIRHLGDPFARKALAEMLERYADFDRAGVQLVAITQTELTAARDFVPRNHVLCPVVTDPEGSLQSQYGIRSDRFLLGSLKGTLSGSPARLFGAINYGHGKKAGPSRQLPAEFVIDGEGRILHLRYATSITEGPQLDDLLRAATQR
jgi:peroxiredoxin